jgi:hypothetical protein
LTSGGVANRIDMRGTFLREKGIGANPRLWSSGKGPMKSIAMDKNKRQGRTVGTRGQATEQFLLSGIPRSRGLSPEQCLGINPRHEVPKSFLFWISHENPSHPK